MPKRHEDEWQSDLSVFLMSTDVNFQLDEPMFNAIERCEQKTEAMEGIRFIIRPDGLRCSVLDALPEMMTPRQRQLGAVFVTRVCEYFWAFGSLILHAACR